MSDLIRELDAMRQRMIDNGRALETGVSDLERMIEVTRNGAVAQIRAVSYRLETAQSDIAGELQRLHQMMVGNREPEPAPAIEDRFTAPKFLKVAGG